MKSYDAAATIEAEPETVWAILTDAPAYSEWDAPSAAEGAQPGTGRRSGPLDVHSCSPKRCPSMLPRAFSASTCSRQSVAADEVL